MSDPVSLDSELIFKSACHLALDAMERSGNDPRAALACLAVALNALVSVNSTAEEVGLAEIVKLAERAGRDAARMMLEAGYIERTMPYA